jgi:hypothetical protein
MAVSERELQLGITLETGEKLEKERSSRGGTTDRNWF